MTHQVWVRSAAGLGAYVAERRAAVGLTQHELAKKAGVSREWMGRFERGTSDPSLVSAMRVLNVLQIKLLAQVPISKEDGETP